MQGTTMCRILKLKQYLSKKQVHQVLKKIRREQKQEENYNMHWNKLKLAYKILQLKNTVRALKNDTAKCNKRRNSHLTKHQEYHSSHLS